MIESFRERAILGGTSLGLFLASIHGGARPGNAEIQGQNSLNQADSHSLYIDNPGLIDQAIKNARLNIPKVDSLLGPDLQVVPTPDPERYCREGYYPRCIQFTDRQGTRKLWGVDNGRFGIPPNDPDKRTGTIDDWNLDRMQRINYIQPNMALYPETVGTFAEVVIGNAVVDITSNRGYMGTAVSGSTVETGNTFYPRVEKIESLDTQRDFSTRRVFSNGLPQGGVAGNPFSFMLFVNSSPRCMGAAVEVGIQRSVIISENGTYSGCVNTFGDLDIFQKLDTVTATPTRTAIPSPSSTPAIVIRASRFEIQPPPSITWQDGSMEDDYVALRAGNTGVKLAPGINPLPKDSTSYTDPSPSPNEPCYLIVARRAGVTIANSDLMCILFGIQSPTNVPEGFSVGLMGQTAIIRLRRTALFDGYGVVALNSAGQRVLPFPGDRITDTITDPTCYIGAGIRGGVVTLTNGLCVFPGIANGIN